jgi:MFS family permease
VRYLVMVLVSLASATAYLTRHSIAPSTTTIQADVGITTEQMGVILGSMSIGYFVFQIPTGWLGTRFGTRFALPFLCVAWSACTVWFAAGRSYLSLLIARIAFGGMQAGLVPNSALVVKDWFPLNQRGIASAANAAAMSVGGAATIALTAVLLETLNWRTVFVLLAVVSLVWAAGFYLLFRTHPADHPWVNGAELDLIRRGTVESDKDRAPLESEPAKSEPSVSQMVLAAATSLSFWAICVQSGFRAAGYQMFVTWFPAFLEKGYGVTRESAGLLASSPLIGVVFGALAGGRMIDFLLNRTGSKWISRCGVAVGALALAGLFCVTASWTASPQLLVASMVMSAFFSGLGGPAAWAATMDVAGRYTAVIMALMNMGGTLGGFFLPIVVGHMIADIERSGGDWNQVLYLIAGIYWAAAICWIFINPNRICIEPRTKDETIP